MYVYTKNEDGVLQETKYFRHDLNGETARFSCTPCVFQYKYYVYMSATLLVSVKLHTPYDHIKLLRMKELFLPEVTNCFKFQFYLK